MDNRIELAPSSFVAMIDKPLYPYQASPEIFHCPADKGDIYYGYATNCYYEYGNSYLTQWALDMFRTKVVCGHPGIAPSIKVWEVARSSANKLIHADWIWHPNRGVTNPKSVWHNYRGQSLAVVLWGDGHVTSYKFPVLPAADPFWQVPPNMTNAWW